MKITVTGLSDTETEYILDRIKSIISERPGNDDYGELKIGIWKDDA